MRQEEFISTYLKSLPRSYGCALDIGANYGIYTQTMSQKFQKVYAFEPHPENIAILNENTSTFNNVVVVPLALSQNGQSCTLIGNGYDSGGHSIMEDLATHGTWGHSLENTIVVPSTTLDAFCIGKNISLMKCDIEGGEYEIFYSASETLAANDLTILLETHQVSNWEKDQKERDRLQEYFLEFGYVVYNTEGYQVSQMDYDTHYIIFKE